MTKTEIYQALADGKATSVQRRSGSLNPSWFDALSDSTVIGWLAADSGRFDENRYRLKPTPVPSGDLTWEEAEAAFKRGEKVEWWSPYPKHEQSWKPWVSGDVFSDCKNLTYRLAPAPKMRTIKAEELPAVFWVRFGDDDSPVLCDRVRKDGIFALLCWYTFDGLNERRATYSEHHTRGPWLKFEKEEQQ